MGLSDDATKVGGDVTRFGDDVVRFGRLPTSKREFIVIIDESASFSSATTRSGISGSVPDFFLR